MVEIASVLVEAGRSIKNVVVLNSMIDQYFSESCEQNKKPILSILKNYLYGKKHLLEIGSGTGQHAAYFASKFPSITWQTSDKAENHTGIKAWIDYSKLDNILPPMKLDVSKDAWPKNSYDIVFSANTAHIMSKENIHSMFTGISKVLLPENEFLLYGPFNIDGKYTADSNMEFDKALKIRDPGMGVRDIEWLEGIGAKNKIFLKDKINMPADNMILVWKQI